MTAAPAIHVLPDPDAMSRAAAERIVNLAGNAIGGAGTFHVALAGGSTPRRLYELLATPRFAQQLPWADIHIYFGDERAVPPDHADSNFHMVRESLLSKVPLPEANCHPMHADPTRLERDAGDYSALLSRSLPRNAAGIPCFDLILLGLGRDGHTASLFPSTPILEERERWVAPVQAPAGDSWRLSLTYPVLNAARQLLFLVAGTDKAAVVQQVLRRAGPDTHLPAQCLAPAGDVEWYLDAAAAAGIQT